MSFFKMAGMKRYQTLENAVCLICGEWLCVMAGTYSGEIICGKCKANNLFKDSSKPVECGFPQVRPELKQACAQ
jgi:hypothetical protein